MPAVPVPPPVPVPPTPPVVDVEDDEAPPVPVDAEDGTALLFREQPPRRATAATMEETGARRTITRSG